MSHSYSQTSLLSSPHGPLHGRSRSVNIQLANVAHPTALLTRISERLYLASYVHPPNADTPFPYSEAPASSRKRTQRGVDATPLPGSRSPCYFTVDDTLLYNAFHHDFGPLHIGHLYRFAIQFHDILGAKQNKDRPIVFWSASDPRSESLSRLRMPSTQQG